MAPQRSCSCSVPAFRLPSRIGLGGLALSVALFSGCPGGGDTTASDGTPTPAPQGTALQDSWMFAVAEDPARLGPMELQGAIGTAWLDLYHNDLGAASASFGTVCTPSAEPLAARAAAGYPCIGLSRALLERAQTLAGAAEIDRVARRQFYAHRRKNNLDVLASVHQPYFEGLTLLRSGASEAGKAMLAGYTTAAGADPLLAALAKRIGEGWDTDPLVQRLWGDSAAFAPADSTLGELPASDATKGYRERLVVMEAIAHGDVAEAMAQLRSVREQSADYLEQLEGGEDAEDLAVDLFHFDSTFLRSLSRLHALSAVEAIGGAPELALLSAEAGQLLGQSPTLPTSVPSVLDGLAFVVFSGWLTPADRLASLRSAGRPGALARLGAQNPGLLSSAQDKVSDLDSFVRLSNALRGQLAEAIRGTSPNGANMDRGMGLSERFVGRLLVDGAIDLQRGMDTRLEENPGKDMETAGVKARTLLEDALDKNPSPPSQRLKKAGISYRNDPPMLIELARANLDTKRPYYANEYIRPLTEVLPELLPVRESLTALDSAWNPMRKGSVRGQ